ncbi:MAG: hypothetical protein PWQ97_399 [Tepidanaerobacteraceae bacterium]|nr:hypothetical protein [Tepidanaerobacteraceae bacterium]
MEDFLREMARLKLALPVAVIKGGTGVHRGAGAGYSQEFYGHHGYIPGEDIRKIDWKAYARTEQLFVKEFTEEKQMHVRIILDASASMGFGGRCKWEAAKLISLGLSHIALKQGDRLSFVLAGQKMKVLKQEKAGIEGFFELVRLLQDIKPEGAADFERIMETMTGSTAMTYVISDFFGERVEKSVDFLGKDTQYSVLVQTLAQEEISPSIEGDLKLIDMETGAVRRIRATRQLKEKYRRRMTEFMSRIKYMCMSRGMGYFMAECEESPVKLIKSIPGVYV